MDADRGCPATGLPASAGHNTSADQLRDEVCQAVSVAKSVYEGLLL